MLQEKGPLTDLSKPSATPHSWVSPSRLRQGASLVRCPNCLARSAAKRTGPTTLRRPKCLACSASLLRVGGYRNVAPVHLSARRVVMNLEKLIRVRVTSVAEVLTEQAIDLGNLSLFRMKPSFERTLHLADLGVVHLGRNLLRVLIRGASGVAKATAFLRKHLTWLSHTLNTPTDIPTIREHVCQSRRYGRHHNALGTALATALAASI